MKHNTRYGIMGLIMFSGVISLGIYTLFNMNLITASICAVTLPLLNIVGWAFYENMHPNSSMTQNTY